MKQIQVQKYRRMVYSVFIIAALLYSVWSCIDGISTAMQTQMESYLQKQAHRAAQSALAGEEDQVFVSLRRDQNDYITAVTVNGILLNQLQMEYISALNNVTAPCCYSLSMADLLGCRVLSFLPWRIKIPCRAAIIWESNILSRTLENNDRSKQFQLLLVVSGTAEHFVGMESTYQQELLLYETVIYATAS